MAKQLRELKNESVAFILILTVCFSDLQTKQKYIFSFNKNYNQLIQININKFDKYLRVDGCNTILSKNCTKNCNSFYKSSQIR